MTSFGCPLCCHQKFDTILALREHLLYFIYRPLICVLCRVTLGGICDLIPHLQNHLNSDKASEIFGLKSDTQTENSNDFMTCSDINNANHFQNSCINNNFNFDNSAKGEYYTGTKMAPQLLSNTQQQSLTHSDFASQIEQDEGYDFCLSDASEPFCMSDIPSIDEESDSSLTSSGPSFRQNESCEGDDLTSNFTEYDGNNREPIQAFVCKICGTKIIGKDFYFTHLQSNCKLNQNSVEQVPSDKQDHSDTNKENYNNACSTKIDNSEVELQPYKNVEKNDLITDDLNDQPAFSGTSIQNLRNENTPVEHANSRGENSRYTTDCSDIAKLENVGTLLDKKDKSPFLFVPYSDKKPISVESSPSQTYIHKKFDHDQDRTTSNFSKKPKSEVQCLIQNFQSLLVNKLNQAFETNPDVISLIKSPPKKEPLEIEAVPLIERKDPSPIHGQPSALKKSEKVSEKTPQKRANYECSRCSKTFLGKKAKDTHIRNHCRLKPFRCTRCPKSFAKSVVLGRHRREVHSNMTFVCSLCGQHFTSYRSLNNHKGIHEKKCFTCQQCAYVCHTASGLRTHTHEAHSSKIKEIFCPQCGEKFKRNYGLKRHIERKHQTENLVCRYCDKIFRCKEDLKLHLNTHLKYNSLMCSICNKNFTTPGSLKRHGSKHKQNPNYFKCNICSAHFTRKDSLLNHIKLHTSKHQSGSKCLKSFKEQRQTKKNFPPQSQDSQFRCEACQKTFKFKTVFKKHTCQGIFEVT